MDRVASSSFVAGETDFQTTVVTAINQLGHAARPNGPEVLLLGQSADGKLWSRRIHHRYGFLEGFFVSGFIRAKALDRIAIVVPNRVVLLDRTDPIDAGAAQEERVARLSSAARRAWRKAQ
jgi:hypothetical protein